MKTKLKVLSLFDGISCARVALERLGIQIDKYYASEVDKYAIQIAQKNYPDTIQVGDITKLNGEDFKDIDLMIGGSPCQDLSIAKKDRQGLKGARSGLFFEYVRLLKEIKPKYWVLENVNSMPKEAKEQISEILGVQPIMINAALVSAQNRKRLWWTNIQGVTQPEDLGILLKDILQDNAEVDERMVTNGKSFVLTSSYNGAVEWNSVAKKQRIMVRIGQFNTGGQGDRVYSPDGKSVSLSANGGGRGAKTGLYLVAPNGKNIVLGDSDLQVFGERRTELGKQSRKEIKKETGKDSTLRSKDRKEYFGKDGVKANCVTTGLGMEGVVAIIPEATKKGYAVAKDGDSVDMSFPSSRTRRGRVGNKAKNIMTSQNIGVFTEGTIRKLTCVECERLQSLEDNFTEGVSNTQRYKALGNGFNVEVVKHILSFIK